MLQELGWQDLQSRRRDLRLALLYKVVMGHVGILPEHVGLVAADDRTRAKHQFKFRAVGSSTQAFRHSFAVRTVGDWNSLPSHVVEQSTAASFKAELSRLTSAASLRTVKRHPPFTRYSTRRTVNYLSESESIGITNFTAQSKTDAIAETVTR